MFGIFAQYRTGVVKPDIRKINNIKIDKAIKFSS